MSTKKIFAAGLLGATLTLAIPASAGAETLKIVSGSVASALVVPMNRAVVVESDVPFAELSIANPGIADISTLSDRTIYVLGKAPGRTTLTLLAPDGKLITNVDVQVSLDVAEFKERLEQILPGEKIEVRTANDGIVLSGTVSSTQGLDRALDLAERYAPGRVSNLMGVGGVQQVMLKVRFAEVRRGVAKQLQAGVAASVSTSDLAGAFGLGPSAGLALGETNDATGLAPISPSVIPNSENTGQALLGFSAGAFEFGILLEALESKGLVRTLSEPNLTTLSGQEASFLAGGEYPIPVRGDNNTISVDYKPFGVELAFTPRVVDGDVINLMINAAVSGIDPTVSVTAAGISVNAFRRREAETTVEMRDGESFAIAGLLQDDFTDLNDQVPWLGDIPVLGALFRSTDYQRNQSELVIIVTPHLVTPTRGEALALPTDRVRPPSEAELFLFGKTASSGGAVGEVAKQDYSGSYGYVME
ncbi:type II and III secretion system protein family protein [Defluviimonas sp. WL0024]|uniref:Type II and III secretion system protein family protein n=2 Tax=Albidovulum TaxID=205889 RepID=A0ABT3J731_9RHOB|nr:MULTISPECIES: type II and III secretion system protein family protein [Defluviimonas]MCU9847258.1 type II and III secretion system protein family protein [Defluviimonas sp. WL0024]MCW3783479.1 type II and III secretion system protein family protein [Defluviimonas salinarum]